MSKVTPFLWFAEQAEEAVRLYVSLVPDSRIDSVNSMPADSPSGPAGSVVIINFTLGGRPFTAMQAGRHEPFNDAISLMIGCDDQAEVDRLWDGLLADGGKPQACGWLQDRWGVRWQITPKRLLELMGDPDRAKGKRVAEAMMQMVKIDIAALEAAAAAH